MITRKYLYLISEMKNIILTLLLLSLASSIEIPLHEGPRCMIITSSFEVFPLSYIAFKSLNEIPQNTQQERRLNIQSTTY